MALYYNDLVPRCVVCGGKDLVPTGTAHTPQNSYTAMRCVECGKVQRKKETLLDKEKRSIQHVNVR